MSNIRIYRSWICIIYFLYKISLPGNLLFIYMVIPSACKCCLTCSTQRRMLSTKRACNKCWLSKQSAWSKRWAKTLTNGFAVFMVLWQQSNANNTERKNRNLTQLTSWLRCMRLLITGSFMGFNNMMVPTSSLGWPSKGRKLNCVCVVYASMHAHVHSCGGQRTLSTLLSFDGLSFWNRVFNWVLGLTGYVILAEQ